jgi:xanthine/uracil permease
MRWPLYFAQIALSLVVIVLTLLVYRKRREGWGETIVILPWLAGTVAFALLLACQVVQSGWQDLPPLASNAFWSNLLGVAGPASAGVVMALRLWKRPG